jgi:pimeloyl-ACP methyl ester carboxylesterase
MEKTMAQAVVPIHGVLSTAKDRESQSVTRGTAMAGTYLEAPNKRVSANGIDYAYRELGDGAVPLVLLHHFRGNLDYWDPALIDALASTRRVVTFDNAGVGGSTGMTPSTVEQMAHDAIAFLTAMELAEVDVLGFSIGSFVAQEMALIRPSLVRKLVLASSAPKGGRRHARLGARGDQSRGRTGARPQRVPPRVLHGFNVESTRRARGLRTLPLEGERPRRADQLANETGSVRRRVRLGHPRITHCCNDSAPSTSRCSWPTATATP